MNLIVMNLTAKRSYNPYLALALAFGLFFVWPTLALAQAEAGMPDLAPIADLADESEMVNSSTVEMSVGETSVQVDADHEVEVTEALADETETEATETAASEATDSMETETVIKADTADEETAEAETVAETAEPASIDQSTELPVEGEDQAADVDSQEVATTTGDSSTGRLAETKSTRRIVSSEPTKLHHNDVADELAISNEINFNTADTSDSAEKDESETAVSDEVGFALADNGGDDGGNSDDDTEAELAVSDEVDLSSSDDSGNGGNGGDEGTEPEVEVAVSDELSLTTVAINQSESEIAVSSEQGFVAAGETGSDPEIAISAEINFITTSGGNGGGGDDDETEIAVSAEVGFTTAGEPASEIAVSDEVTFTTSSGGGGGGDDESEIAVSAEITFTTASDASEIAVSDERSFTTSSGGGGGGGGSGGGGGGRRATDDEEFMCQPYLLKYIRLGADNDPFEVLKLKAFLNAFEGFNLPLTPIYDLETFRAVEIFQQRYASDIIQPWRNLYGPTGYVYITTSLKINYIVCGITDPIDLDLFAREDLIRLVPAAAETFRELEAGEGEVKIQGEDILIPTPDGEVGTLEVDPGNLFDFFARRLFAGVPFVPFDLDCFWPWLIVLILLLLIIYLIARNRQLQAEVRDYEDEFDRLYGSEEGEEAPLVAPADDDLPGVPAMPMPEDEEPVIEEEDITLEPASGDEVQDEVAGNYFGGKTDTVEGKRAEDIYFEGEEENNDDVSAAEDHKPRPPRR